MGDVWKLVHLIFFSLDVSKRVRVGGMIGNRGKS